MALPISTQQRTVLLGTDLQNSVLVEVARSINHRVYSVYGHQSAQLTVITSLGFNGERCESLMGWYFLGNGYRAYNTRLMRFHAPDSLSPFEQGGLNAYMYCGGNPVMNNDPTGHNIFTVLGTYLKTIKNNIVGNYQMQRAGGHNPVTALISSVNGKVGLTETLGVSNLKGLSSGVPANPSRALLSAKEGGLHLKVGGVPSSTPSSASNASLPGSSGRGPGGGYSRRYEDDSWHDSRARMDTTKPTIVTRYPKDTKRDLSPNSQKRVKDIRD